MKKREYEKALRSLQMELVHLQEWVRQHGERVIIIFEGRDAAGKGGVIKALTDRVSSRVFRIVALPAPSDREQTQMYFQRYMSQFPSGGEIVVFDRSWYNRAGVEPVMGFCTEEQTKHFLKVAPRMEKEIVNDGIHLFKFWLEVSAEVQLERFRDRVRRADKQWKLSPMDLEARRRWYDYSRCRDRMLDATDTKFSPWHIVPADNKYKARLNCIAHLLDNIPYKQIKTEKVKLPETDDSTAYDDIASMKGRRYVEEKY